MTGTLKVDEIKNLNGVSKLRLDRLATNGRYTRTTTVQVDAANYSSTNAWTLGPTFGVINNLQANSLLKLFYAVPTRNESTSWGGCYIEPQVRFNEGTWQSLGSCGHDGGVMYLGNAFIGTYRQIILIDPGQAATFSAQFRLYFRSFDGTVGLNNALGHDLNSVSGTAPLISGANGQQHFTHLIVEELARYN
jgi:hypothetical protein